MQEGVFDCASHTLKGTSVILEGISFLIDFLEYDEGLAIHLQTTTSESKYEIRKMYESCIGKEISVSIGNHQSVAIVKSICCSSESYMGTNLRNFNNIRSCKVVLDISLTNWEKILQMSS